jgi:acetyl esterase/lipase
MARQVIMLLLLGFGGSVMALLPRADAGGRQEKQKQKAAQPAKVKLPDGVSVDRDVAYGPHERNKLDVYRPKADKPLPLVIWVHGGAWLGGSKEGNNPALRLLEKGYAVAAVNYRLSQHALYPAQIEDCKAAVRFLRANAGKYNLDPAAFGAWGSSAGGHLVALLGTTGGVKELDGTGPHQEVSSRVQAVVDWYGPTDLTKMGEQARGKGTIDHDAPTAPEAKLIGGPVQQNKEKAAKANPITYVTADDAPFLIMHGDADLTVPAGQSELLHAALKKAGVASDLVIVKGVGHDGRVGAGENAGKIVAFFDKHLKK